MILVLVHGWGCGPGVWGPMLRALRWPGPVQRIDLGFFGSPVLPPLPDEPWLGVGFSLGYLWLLGQLAGNHACGGLVSIGGFSRFVAGPDFPHGVPVGTVRRMARRLRESPAAVLADFRRKAGLPALRENGAFHAERLLEGLGWLQEGDRRGVWQGPQLALACQDDQIVTPEHAMACFADIEWREQGGHAPLLTAPAWCAQQVQRWEERW